MLNNGKGLCLQKRRTFEKEMYKSDNTPQNVGVPLGLERQR
jgi:hypothetical protein